MVKKKVKKEVKNFVKKIKDAAALSLDKILYDNIKEYSEYVLEDRALPAWQDGLKPSQRRLLWALYHNLNSKPDKTYLKCARITGQAMLYHPHGESYQTLVNMIEGTPCPLLYGLGNFGSYSSYNPAGASRYTEAKSSEFTIATFFDPRFLPVMEMVSNYDSSATEPVYLPAQLPIVLALGSTGIAVGVTTDIPAFTVPSLIKAVQLALREKNYIVPIKKLTQTLEFASAYGGKLDEAASEIKSVLETGVGTISWECEYDVVKDEVNIYGFPPGWNFDTKMAAIQKIPDVATCVDISAGRDIHVKVTFRQVDRDKKDAAIKKVVSLLRSKKHHKLNVMTRYLQKDDVIDFTKGEFESISVQQLLAKWVAYRVDLECKALTAEIEKLAKDLEKYELLKLAADNLDIIFKILKTKGVDKVKELSKKLKITPEQSSTIWQIPVGRLDRLSSSEFVKNIQETKDKIKSVKKRLKAPEDSILLHMKENMKALANPIAYHPES